MFDELGRIAWDDYFLCLAFMVSQRSLDPDTKHGCVAVKERTILSTGYNSPPRGCNDKKVPLTRPAKYNFFVHSELNCILNSARSGVSLKDSTFYITGPPCRSCFLHMLNVGVSKIVAGPVKSACITEEDQKAIDLLKENQPVEYIEINDFDRFKNHFYDVVNYMDKKSDVIHSCNI